MTAPTPTRERLITEAIRLFGDKGFEATSVSQIEAAAGLSAGSGALYRHFKSKDDVLTACIDRQLDRRSAMRKMRTLFTGLSDLHSELTVIGRYLFSVIDSETELLQIAACTPPGLSEQLDNAYAALIETLRDELHGWISDWASRVAPEHTTSGTHRARAHQVTRYRLPHKSPRPAIRHEHRPPIRRTRLRRGVPQRVDSTTRHPPTRIVRLGDLSIGANTLGAQCFCYCGKPRLQPR